MSIAERYTHLKQSVPPQVTIVLAAKTRSPEEIEEAIDAGATDIGENYVQEAEAAHSALGDKAGQVNWHMIGHLQKNKINKALQVFDVIQTVESLKKAGDIDKRVPAAKDGAHVLPVYLEVNIGGEETKTGISPGDYDDFEQHLINVVRGMTRFEHVRLEGLMTMGPLTSDPEGLRPYFRRVREMFDRIIDLGLPHVNMKHLSMGMTHSYQVAIEEGANMIRVGTAVFGERK